VKHAILLILLASIHLGGCSDNVTSDSPSVDVLSDINDVVTNDATTSDGLDNEDSGPADITEPDDADTPDPFEGAEAFIIEQINQGQIPGLAAAVTYQGAVVWTGAYGYANVEDKLAATVNTPFMLASVSKTVTGVAVMHAVEDGSVALDDSINDILPFVVDNPRVDDEVINLRHLVSHTSGIRDNWGNMPYFDGDPTVPLGSYLEGYLLEGGEWYDPTANFYDAMPGESFEYGNIATALSGFVVEHVTQTPFDDYCDTHIFDVLGMDHTGWYLADFDATTVAMPYEVVGGNYKTDGHYGYADYPDGQLRSSISDIARFLATISGNGAFDGAQVLSENSLEELLSPQYPKANSGQYVFWYESTIAGRKVIGHNGGDIGVATQISFSPETGVGVIVLMNVSWSDKVTAAAEAVQGYLYDVGEQL
tara:strand:- start:235 stop:1503 length:1269 start_codon:yes stop_codon:yes gene_type:complete